MVRVGRAEPVDILEARVWVAVAGPGGEFRELEAVVDTGFSGFLTLPEALIQGLRLPLYDYRRVRSAGNRIELAMSFRALVQWQGRERLIIVHQAENPNPLLGMAMLEGWRLIVDTQVGGPVTIAPLE